MITAVKRMGGVAEAEAESAAKGRSLWADAGIRFRRNKAAVFSLILLTLIVLFSIIGPFFARYSNESVDWNILSDVQKLGQPSFENGHYFGTDKLGRDLFARVLQGTQVSLMVGAIGSMVAIIIGTFYGAISGYIGGRLDDLMMRFVDILYSIPYMFILILMLLVFGRSLVLLFVGIGLISWLGMARIVRGQTMALKNKEFVEAAVAGGARSGTIVFRHIVPNLLGVVVVYATLLVPEMILTESFLSFLGLGVQEPNTSLGALISDGASTMQQGMLWQLLFPLTLFVMILGSLFFIGDGLRDALDPKDR